LASFSEIMVPLASKCGCFRCVNFLKVDTSCNSKYNMPSVRGLCSSAP
jgi:hypothetical protein